MPPRSGRRSCARPSLGARRVRVLLCAVLAAPWIGAPTPARAQGAPPVSARVAMHHGVPTMFISGRPEYPMLYALTDVPGGRWSWEEMPSHGIATFCRAGVRLVQVDLQPDFYWTESGVDVTTARRQLRGALQACPDAALFLRLNVGAPKWWIRRHPEELTRYADTTARPDRAWGLQRSIEDDVVAPTRPSLASSRWREDASVAVRALLQALARTPEGDRLAGVQVAGGIYGEWHYWGFIDDEPDVGAPMQAHFRRWLRERYRTDEALRLAWGRADASIEAATVPDLAARRTRGTGMFRDPVRQRDVIDYYRAQHAAVADDILHFTRLVKRTWPRPIVTGAFYGYFFAVFGREAAGGHLESERVLDSPDIDYLAGPNAYYPASSAVGDPYRSRSLVTSVRLHGKLWLDEMDQQPPLSPWRDTSYASSVRASVAQVRRNVLFGFTKGTGLWFYDFGVSGFNGGPRLDNHGTAGWWDDPGLMEEIARLHRVLAPYVDRDYDTGADVLLVHDTDVFYALGSDKHATALAHWADNWLPVGVFRSGAVFDPIHLDDLARVDLRHYRTIVFVNTFVLSPAQRRLIADRVARDGRHLVWIYAPGYGDGTRLDPALVSDVTGIRVRPVDVPGVTRLETSRFSDATLGTTVFGDSIRPLFAVDDSAAETFGVYGGTHYVAAARKSLPASTSWFLGLPPDDAGFWRGLLRETGTHLYTEPGAVVYAGRGTVALHGATGGRRLVHLRNGRTVTLDLPSPFTVLLDAESGRTLLP